MTQAEELNNRIVALNARVKELNVEASRNKGRQDTLTEQLKKAQASYKSTYGVDLEEVDLEKELRSVQDATLKEIEAVSAIVTAIDNKDFDTANRLAGVKVESTAKPIDVVAPVVAEEPEVVKVVEENKTGMEALDAFTSDVAPQPQLQVQPQVQQLQAQAQPQPQAQQLQAQAQQLQAQAQPQPQQQEGFTPVTPVAGQANFDFAQITGNTPFGTKTI